MSPAALIDALPRRLAPAPIQAEALHAPVEQVQLGLRGQGSECPRCGAKGRVSASCAEFLSQPFPESLKATAKRVHDKVARGPHSHLKCAHDDCGLVTIGVGRDTQRRLYAGLCEVSKVVRPVRERP